MSMVLLASGVRADPNVTLSAAVPTTVTRAPSPAVHRDCDPCWR